MSNSTKAKKFEDLKELVLFMKANGVSKFTALGVEVEFSPFGIPGSSVQPVTHFDDKEQAKAELKEMLKTAIQDDEVALQWST